MIQLRLYLSSPVLWSVAFTLIESKEDDFNCPEDCGLYSGEDKVSPFLQTACKAMEESTKCEEKFETTSKKKKKKKRKKSSVRIVGGKESKYPMPWMVR